MLDHDLQAVVESAGVILQHSDGYPKRYRKALRPAIDYIDSLVKQIPGPLMLSADRFGTDSLVRALFASPKEVDESLRLSIAMRTCSLPAHEMKNRHLFALMGVRWERTLHYVADQQDEMIVFDVPKHAINFKDHTFTLPACSDQGVREQVRKEFLLRLANQFSARIREIRAQRDECAQEEKRLKKRLHHSPDQEAGSLQLEIERVNEKWYKLNQKIDIDHLVVLFEEIMTTPESFLAITPYNFVVDKMGFESPEDGGGERLELAELSCADLRKWTVMIAQFPWQLPPSEGQEIEKAYRRLTIA